LTETDQDTTENKYTDFVEWSESLDECGDDGNEAAKSHGPSSAKEISLGNN
jgi:hypothetical protein